MILYLIRHGAPDYEKDELLPEGREQARAVAKRLMASGVDEIHSSPMGRAQETARPLAEALQLPVTVEPWAYELGEEVKTTYPDGCRKAPGEIHPCYLHQQERLTLTTEESLRTVEGLAETDYLKRYQGLSVGVDGMLERLGYRRNGNGFYDVIAPNDRHVALFCHVAMMRVLLSHLLHFSPHVICSLFMGHFTGITILSFDKGVMIPNHPVAQTCPQLICYGDVGHLYAEGRPLVHYTKQFSF